MRKHFGTILMIGLLSFSLTGCASTVNEKQIQSELETNTQFNFLDENEKIEELVIEERQTDKKNKTDKIWCTVKTMDSEVSYQKNVTLTYGLYDKEGWVLDGVTVNHPNNWIRIPLKGISEDNILSSLTGQYVVADNENWNIEPQNVKSIIIDKQETNLEEKSDTVIVTLTLDSDIEEATGQLTVNYKFDDEWKIDFISGNEGFTATVKPEMALNISDNELLAELEGYEMQYGASNKDAGNGFTLVNTASQQIISIQTSEVSDFVIENQKSLSKGSYQEYECSGILTKEHAVFKLYTNIQYHYENASGWTVQPIMVEPELVSVDLVGEWKGNYTGSPYSGEAVLNITEIADDGSITGTYSYTPSVIEKYSEPGSYNVSGKIDMSTLQIKLTAGDWIDKPESASTIGKSDITARFCVDSSVIEGLGQKGYPFTVTKEK